MQNDLKNENPVLDGIDRRLVETLSVNARTTTADLARQVGMSAPSVADRLRRLEESGVIRAYTLDVDPVALGYTLDEFSESLQRIADGSFDVAPLITGRVGLAEVAGAFDALRDPEQHAKILVEPWRA